MRPFHAIAAVAFAIASLGISCGGDDPSLGTRSEAINSSPAIGNFAVYGANSVVIRDFSEVLGGDIGVENVGGSALGYPGFPLVIGAGTNIDARRSLLSDTTLLLPNSVVGSVQTNHLTNEGGQVLGGVVPLTVAMPSIPANAAVTPGSTAVSVAAAATQSLCPGQYGAVSVGAGATLNLLGGVYHFASLSVAAGGTVTAQAQSQLRIAGQLSVSAAGTIAPASGHTANWLVIEVSGSDTNQLQTAVQMLGPVAVTALLKAPNGTFLVTASPSPTSTNNLVGAFVAQSVDIGQNSAVVFQDGFGDISPLPPVCDDKNSCTTDSCVGNACVHSPIASLVGVPCAARGTTCSFANECTAAGACACVDDVPPDPSTVAPPIDRTVVSVMPNIASFLYSGSAPIQRGVAAGTINGVRASVLRGRVLDGSGAALPYAGVTVLNHPEYGGTISRADGSYDLVVNGGGPVTLVFQRSGYIPAQRNATAYWGEFTSVDDVAMLHYDTAVTTLTLASPTVYQVARGSTVTDASGTRTQTLLFPPGVTASFVGANGSLTSAGAVHVRATEYTVGANGPKSMPAALPPTSGYTYAVEFSIDEADAQGATGVVFSMPLVSYVENFIGFGVGTVIPLGNYDRTRAQWQPVNDGRVIKILSITGGLADVDTTGGGTADDGVAIGMTAAERQQLASLYAAGQTLWRMPISHFSPTDGNFAVAPPANAVGPKQPPDPNRPNQCNAQASGSIIECEDQVLGERIGIAGTPYSLNYRSDRAPGRKAANTIRIPLSDSSLPSSVTVIHLQVAVAGQFHEYSFSPSTNLTTTFTWDGKDAYGRALAGNQPISIRVGYEYNGASYEPLSYFQSPSLRTFGIAPGTLYTVASVLPPPSRTNFVFWNNWNSTVGTWESRPIGLGGWSVNVHHVYDPIGQILYLGDGEKVFWPVGNPLAVKTGAGGGTNFNDNIPATNAYLDYPAGMAFLPDGSYYVALFHQGKIRKVDPDGIITTVAGGGAQNADNIPATQASISQPNDVVVGPDGSFYFTERVYNRVRKVDPNGIITTFAGTGTAGSAGDGGPATAALLSGPRGLAIGLDGSLYIADTNNHRIRRVALDGTIYTFAGTGTNGFNGDSQAASSATLYYPYRVAVGADGLVYVSDTFNERLRVIGLDGRINTVAGTGSGGFSGDGGPPTSAKIWLPDGLTVLRDNTIVFADETNSRVRSVTGKSIATIGGGGTLASTVDNAYATSAVFNDPISVAVSPSGSLIYGDDSVDKVRQLSSPFIRYTGNSMLFPSEDESEVYSFDATGRHLATYDGLLGSIRYQFAYDTAGRLATITDRDGKVTTLHRDASGNLTSISGPFGQTSPVSLDANGWLASIADPSGDTNAYTYSSDGLMATYTDPRSYLHSFSYDAATGRLTHDADPASGSTTLARTEQASPQGFTVRRTSALNRTTTHQVQNLGTGNQSRTVTLPDGTQTSTTLATDGSVQSTAPSGEVSTYKPSPDPRFGMNAPVATSWTDATPGGNTYTETDTRSTTLANVNNPLSVTAQTETSNINGHSFTSAFSASGPTITNTTPLGRQVVSTLDSKGRVVNTHVAGLTDVSRSYNSLGQLTAVTQGARQATLGYDSNGFVSSITDPLQRTVQFVNDPEGRTTQITLPDQRVITETYDASGNLTSVTPPGRPQHTLNYTSIDELASYVPPTDDPGGSTVYSYNNDHQLTQIARPDGVNVTIGYDSAGRRSTVTQPSGTMTSSYSNTTGQLTGIARTDGASLSFGYDGDLNTSVSWSGPFSASYQRTYNADRRIATESINNANAVSFGYDNDGLLTSVGAETITRDSSNGLVLGTTIGNISDTYSYNSFGEVTGYQATYSGTVIFAQQFVRDALGRISEKTETVQGTSHVYDYGYDTAGHLTTVTTDGVQSASYTYDSNGNRLTKTTSGGTITCTYDTQDRLLTAGTLSYSYNANGELTTKTDSSNNTTTTYGMDAFGNLTSVTPPGSSTISYLLDAANRRVQRKVGGVAGNGLIYRSGLGPVAQLDSNGAVTARFVYGVRKNVPDFLVVGTTTYAVIKDHLGSPRLLVDISAGTVAEQVSYDEFGVVTADSNPGFQPFGFAGGIVDSGTGLVAFGVRSYDANSGRWISKDPTAFAGGDTNFYEYSLNDPVNFRDFNGMRVSFGKDPTDEDTVSDIDALNAYLLDLTLSPALGQRLRQIANDPNYLVVIRTYSRDEDYNDAGVFERLKKHGGGWCESVENDNNPNRRTYAVFIDERFIPQGASIEATLAHELGHIYDAEYFNVPLSQYGESQDYANIFGLMAQIGLDFGN